MVIAQCPVDSKTNEIPALQTLLDPLDIKDHVVTCDALHTQKDTARYIVKEKNADYLFTVKDNQPTLKQDIEDLGLVSFPPPQHQTIDSITAVLKSGTSGKYRFKSLSCIPPCCTGLLCPQKIYLSQIPKNNQINCIISVFRFLGKTSIAQTLRTMTYKPHLAIKLFCLYRLFLPYSAPFFLLPFHSFFLDFKTLTLPWGITIFLVN